VVSGKGGTGKTTVAAALAITLARDGRRVLLMEVEGRQGIAQLFDSPPLPYAERKVAVAPGNGEVFALAVDTEEALLEYLDLFYNLRSAGHALKRIGAIDFATTIAPGMRDVLLTGKAKEVIGRRPDGKRGRTYDAVVMDAPPTGRIARFLNVNTEVAGLARAGPIHTQAEGVMALLRSPRTAVHVVTLLEEMPIQETVDGVAELASVGLPVGAVVVNMSREPLLPERELESIRDGDLDLTELARGLKTAGLDPTDDLVAGLADEAVDHAVRVLLEIRLRRALEKLRRPTYELPLLTDSVDLAGLYQLADSLCEQMDQSR
jgi:anion-transporting  ArsA/GET3 family ATPase